MVVVVVEEEEEEEEEEDGKKAWRGEVRWSILSGGRMKRSCSSSGRTTIAGEGRGEGGREGGREGGWEGGRVKDESK